ncbi:50S ribosomal protein L27 [Candidatus Gottesmanbacteria bacterium]|nr:50S ribosomal protein L27 [Candidatus Gottesmanbacteria bacterium]
MAHTKTGASVKGSRDSIAKRLGVKKYGGQTVIPGNIIVRQRGSKVHPGRGVIMGRDYTIMAVKEGLVNFSRQYGKTIVNVSK